MRWTTRWMIPVAALALAAMLAACGGGEELSCGEGTHAVDGACVAQQTACADGTVFDDKIGRCVVDTELTCAAGTEADDGKCVVSEPTSCGTHTERDANTGECIITTETCAGGTAYDADTDTCQPTDEICDTGTYWSDDSGMCLPEARCRPGDVIVGGLCMSPAHELANSADLVEAENNDPALGGSPEQVELAGIGEQVVFAGNIAAPSDIDGDEDNTIDQDRDVYQFEASAGQWLRIGVQSTGLPAPGFKLESVEGDYLRYSPFDTQAARQIVIPRSGDYTLTVLPTIVLESDERVGPIGGDDWGYVGTIERVSGPQAVPQLVLEDSGLVGEFGRLDDNLFEVTELPADGLVELSFDQLSDDIDAEIVVWGGDAEAHHRYRASADSALKLFVPSAETLHVLVDYVRKRGGDDAFSTTPCVELPSVNLGEVGANSFGETAPSTLAGDAELYVIFGSSTGQFIEISHDNEEGIKAAVDLHSASEGILQQVSSLDARTAQWGYNRGVYQHTPEGGLYAARFTSPYETDLIDETITVRSFSPIDLDQLGIGDAVDYTGGALDAGYKHWGLVELTEDMRLTGSVSSADGTVYFKLYDMAGQELVNTSGSIEKDLPAGEYKFALSAYSELGAYKLRLNGTWQPEDELEPNDSIAEAMPAGLGRPIVAELPDSDDVDVFEIHLDQALSNEVLHVDIEGESPGMIGVQPVFDCKLLDDSGTTLIVQQSSTSGCSLVAADLAVGDYYAEISAPSATDYNYAVTAKVRSGQYEAEPNDGTTSPDSAEFAELTAGAGIFGNFTDATDTDYFEFAIDNALAQNEKLQISLDAIGHSGVYLGLELLDGDENTVASTNSSQGSTSVDASEVPPGTYYLEATWMYPNSEPDTEYRIGVEIN